jgi:hypothetical protein
MFDANEKRVCTFYNVSNEYLLNEFMLSLDLMPEVSCQYRQKPFVAGGTPSLYSVVNEILSLA